MPKSKRAKVVHLSKTEKKGKELSVRLFAAVRTSADQYQHCFVFAVENMRNTYLKEIRTQFADSRIFFGKTKVMAKALGLTPEEEHLPNISQLAPYLTGNVGLFFTSQNPQSIISFFQSYTQVDFARAGTPSSRDLTIPTGVVYSRGGEVSVDEDVPIPHSLEASLRKWGMPTRLFKGKVMLDTEYQVCREGQILNSHQTALLKIFGVATAEFAVQIKAFYSSGTQEVTKINAKDE